MIKGASIAAGRFTGASKRGMVRGARQEGLCLEYPVKLCISGDYDIPSYSVHVPLLPVMTTWKAWPLASAGPRNCPLFVAESSVTGYPYREHLTLVLGRGLGHAAVGSTLGSRS